MIKSQSGTSVCLFGTYPIRVDGSPYYLGISGTTERLFQYLLVHAGKETRREYLADLFWRTSSLARQRSALNSAIWRIKRQINDLEGIDLLCDGPAVALQIATSVTVDINEFTDIVHSVSLHEPISETTAERLYEVLNASDVPFMDGVDSDWVLTERERLFNLQIRGMTILMHWLGQERRYEDALEIGRKLLAADPGREAAQCEVMWLYVLNGQRAQALRQYQDFSSWLKQELGVEPMPETRALYDHIRKELNAGISLMKDRSAGTRGNQAHQSSFNNLLGAIERSRRELYEVLSNQGY